MWTSERNMSESKDPSFVASSAVNVIEKEKTMTRTQLCQWYNISMRNKLLEIFVRPKRQDEGVGRKV